MMLFAFALLPTALLIPTGGRVAQFGRSEKPDVAPALTQLRDTLAEQLELERRAVARLEIELAEIEDMLAPEKQVLAPEKKVLPTRGYLSKSAGCYNTDGASGPPPSALTLALDNFGRELKELTSSVLPYKTKFASALEEPCVYTGALSSLTLRNDAIWAREHARPDVPAPLVIKLPYLTLCSVLDTLFDGRPIARFWYLETVARIPYFGYNTMIFLYETLGWWRRSAALKKVHFQEEWNEFHHLLIMESLGGDQAWFDRFIGQHSALAYYLLMTLMWLVSPTLAYNFSELIEAHAVDTYAEFIDANEQTLRELPPPEIARSYYQQAGGERGEHVGAPLDSLYDVFCRIRDDEASHVDSMKECQDPEVRSRARIVELGSIALAAAVLGSTALTFEGVETAETLSAPLVAEVQRSVARELEQVEESVAEAVEQVEERVGEAVQKEEADYERALLQAETSGASKWQAPTKNM